MARDPRLKLLEEFLGQLVHQRRLSPGTARNYRRALEQLFALNDGVSLKKLEPQHLRLQVAELHRHRAQVALHDLLGPLRLLPLIGEHDGLQQRMIDRRSVAQRNVIEYEREGQE